MLSLANNRLDSLPAELGSLVQLPELDVSHNQLEVLPPELGNPFERDRDLDPQPQRPQGAPGGALGAKLPRIP